MKTRTRLLAFALLMSVCVCAATAARQKPAGAGAVVFVVSKYETEVTAEPVVSYRGGKFEGAPAEGAETDSFVREYFRAGRKYRILSGGGEAGTLTITKYMEPGCVELIAAATAETPARLGGRIKVLATDSQTLGRGTPSRRAPTDAERARAVELARAAYAKNGVAAALASKMEVVNLTATDLDRDGKFELVGNFLVEQKAAAAPISYTLFLIMEPEGASLKAAWEWSHKGSEDSFEDRNFVDQVDLDGDGVGEVIAQGTYYESHDYVVYKRQQGRWRPVFKGGGGGC